MAVNLDYRGKKLRQEISSFDFGTIDTDKKYYF